MNNVLGVDSTS